ncbi:hypothetical protein LTS17_007534 [Exophiala oligosperma]
MESTSDVIVVGAGLSGLQAALDLHCSCRSVVVLEARDRVGGKLRTVQRPDGKGFQEFGAAWLNDTNQQHMWNYCRQFGLTPVVQNIIGAVACEDAQGKVQSVPFNTLPEPARPTDLAISKFSQVDNDSIKSIRDKFEAASFDPESFKEPRRTELDNITFERWCVRNGATEVALRTATVWTRGTLGQDPCDVSALAFLEIARGALGIVNLRYDGKHGPQHLRLQEGTQAVPVGMAKLLPTGTIRLNSAVRSISRRAPLEYVVTTIHGRRHQARKVIISIPGPAYKTITFEPALPGPMESYIASVRFGCYVKYICLFRTPFWREKGFCGLSQSFKGPLNHTRDTSVDSQGNYALTCFVTSTPARSWLRLSDRDRREAVLRQLGSLFTVGYDKVKEELLGTITSDWHQDQWAGWGCPFACPPPGVIGGGGTGGLCNPRFGGITVVGTEFTNEWRGYMEGAVRSGKRGASLVLSDLQREDNNL